MINSLNLRAVARRPPTGEPFAPLARSAFRVLGLAASASRREVNAAADSLRLSLKVGATRSFPADLPALGPLSRDESAVRDAVGRLADPPQRLFERLFWFHAPPPSAHVAANTLTIARAAEDSLARGGDAARHDAALLLLAGLCVADPALREREAWERAFALWADVVEGEEFWSLLVAADLKGDYEQLATFAEVRELRARAPRLVSEFLAGRAKGWAARGDFEACGRALEVLRAARLPRPLLDEYEGDILGPVEDEVESVVSSAFGEMELGKLSASAGGAEAAKDSFNRCWRKFEDDAKPALFRFARTGGVGAASVRRALAHAAAKLCELAAAYREALRPDEARAVLRQALALAPPGSAALVQVEEDMRASGRAVEEGAEREETYAEEVSRELRARTSPEPKPSAATAPAAGAGGGDTVLGCVMQIAFYAFMVAGCFALDKCGVIKSGRSTRYGPSYNLNYNIRPFPQFTPVPFPTLHPFAFMPRMTAEELRREMRRGGVTVVDARERAAYDAGHVPGAVWAPEDRAGSLAGRLRRSRLVVVYGEDENAADRAALKLCVAGPAERKPFVLSGGYLAWSAPEVATPPPSRVAPSPSR